MNARDYITPPKQERHLLAHEMAALCKPCQYCGTEFKKMHIDEHERECEHNPVNHACPTCDIGKRTQDNGYCDRVHQFYNLCHAPCDEWVAI
jgi:hypothetical protein